MGFIGNNLGNVLTEAKTIDTIVGDGVNTTLTISTTPGSVNNVEVYYDGIFQSPSEDFTLLGNILTFTSAPPLGVAVVVLSGNDSQVVYPESNTISSAKILDNVIESSKINDIAVEKVSGILPALNGEAITGLNIPAAVDVTTSSANPTVTENKPLGSLWVNSTTGDMFIITDTTTDQNVWINVGVGTEDVVYIPWTFGGTVSGYMAGGYPYTSTDIESISFTSDGNSVTVSGSLTSSPNGSYAHANASSTTHGYLAGGFGPGNLDKVDKYNFSTNNNMVTVANLSVANDDPTGNNSETHGYSANGRVGGSRTNSIEKYAFASDSTTSGHGTTVVASMSQSGQSSTTHGYTSGGHDGTGSISSIDQYSFASDNQGVSYTTMTANEFYFCGHSSSTHGYSSGGNYSTGTNIIERFSFSSTATSSDHGVLSTSRYGCAGNSSITNGYTSGGASSSGDRNTIDKFSFASNTTASSIGNISTARKYGSGLHY